MLTVLMVLVIVGLWLVGHQAFDDDHQAAPIVRSRRRHPSPLQGGSPATAEPLLVFGVVLLLIGCVGLALNQWLSATPKTWMKPPTKVAAERPPAKPSSATVVPRQPGPLALGANGELYVADDALNDILARLPDGRFKVVAGTGKPGYSGDGGPATEAELDRPLGMAVAPDGTLYFADAGTVG